MAERTKTIKGKITRIMQDNKFQIGPNQPGKAGMHIFTSSLISDFHEEEPVEITYDPDTGVVLEMKSMGAQ